MTKNLEDAPRSFHDLGLMPEVLDVLDRLQFTTPTPIQFKSIPIGLTGEDIIGIAQTGTGKTLAFGLPMLQRFVKSGGRGCGRGLVILPTRELALQVDEALQSVGRKFGLKTAVLIGGTPMRPQQNLLRANPDIIIATPGRLIDHLQQRSVDLRTVDTLVLDEADRMLDMGFAPQIKQILQAVPTERQTMLFSATMPQEIVKIANNYMHHPVRVEIAPAGTAAENVSQELFIVPQDEKTEVLSKLLYDYTGTVLVFARTRSRAHRVARQVRNMGHDVAEIHSDRTLPQRRAALDGFKAGTYRILVATDIAARGIDVTGIELVVNYDLPDCAEDYVHRIGRTGRAGLAGHAISFAAPDQFNDVREIEKVLRGELAISEHSEHEFDAPQRGAGRSRQRPQRSAARPAQPRPAQHSSQPHVSQPRSAPRSTSSRRDEPQEPTTPQGLHYSNAGFTGRRGLKRGKHSFSGRRASR
ncbi:MAG: DEAD/DEAH box helicase [Abitibacteriaceae bacterium]|nr:DEAD/DEAH box helicase [Abditibacteriaceae bacterium]